MLLIFRQFGPARVWHYAWTGPNRSRAARVARRRSADHDRRARGEDGAVTQHDPSADGPPGSDRRLPLLRARLLPDVLGFPLQAFVSIGVRQTELPASSPNSPASPRSCRRTDSADRSTSSPASRAVTPGTCSTPTRASCRSTGSSAPDLPGHGRGDPVPGGGAHRPRATGILRKRLIAPAASTGVS